MTLVAKRSAYYKEDARIVSQMSSRSKSKKNMQSLHKMGQTVVKILKAWHMG